MNYNMQSMNKQLPELFAMLQSAEVEIKKEHQVLLVNKTTKFKKGKSKQKGHFKKGGKKVTTPTKKTKADGGIPIGVYPRSGFASWIAKRRAGRLAGYGDWRVLD